ncbi:MAG: hypothetical protein IKH26_04970 [Bacteroidaceae bacterium]|nr:hypothetical protein [Bacteroidaceae bacterium]
MKTYITPETEEVTFNQSPIMTLPLSIDDDETDQALGNQRRNDIGDKTTNKDPWKDGLW